MWGNIIFGILSILSVISAWLVVPIWGIKIGYDLYHGVEFWTTVLPNIGWGILHLVVSVVLTIFFGAIAAMK